jgi:import inner membrane translocase subunit TIM16
MVGPLGRILAQVVVPVIAVLARALPAAYAAAVQNAKKNGAQAARDPSPFSKATMSRSEAFQIMNVSEQEATAEAIQKVRFRLLRVLRFMVPQLMSRRAAI